MILGWTNGHAARLREFLGTETGSMLIQGMRAAADNLGDGKTLEEEALLAREAKGARRQVDVVLRAASFEESKPIERDDIDIEEALTEHLR